MKYAVKIDNHLKGMKEIAIFETRKAAEKCFEKLNELWNNETLSDAEMETEYYIALEDCISYIDYWEARNIEMPTGVCKINNLSYSVNNNGKVSKETSNVRFVFDGRSVCVPA